MKLRFKSPKIVNKATSAVISKKVSNELDGDCHIRFNEAEIGMKSGKVYAKFSVEGEMDRKDFMKFIKMVKEGS
jgi:hypothetical protein